MAGRSKGFLRSKFKLPRYKVKIAGVTIFERALRDIGGDHYYFICPKDHFSKYHLGDLILGLFPEAKILLVENGTAGQACTALWADAYISNDDPLLILSPMQIINWSSLDFLQFCEDTEADAAMIVCPELLTQSSSFFARVDLEKITVKGVVSDDYVWQSDDDIADESFVFDCGIYYFKYGQYFTRWTKSMLKRNGSVDNEFWVAFSMNDGIVEGRSIKPYIVDGAAILKRVNDVRQFVKRFPKWAKP